jgi:hypothetical protein
MENRREIILSVLLKVLPTPLNVAMGDLALSDLLNLRDPSLC